jgi:death-on-curing protein
MSGVDAVLYLTLDQVIDLHDAAVAEFGGLNGIRSPQQLAAAVAQPQQSAFGEDAYATVAEKAAAYGFFIAEAQAFIDGNKRAAALAMETFLYVNGYELLQEDDEIAQMFEDLGAKVIGQGEFFGWVCNHARPKKKAAAAVVQHPSSSSPSSSSSSSS